MQGFAVLLTICFGIAAAQVCEYDHGNGQPACIAEEMNRPWRNNWDPVHYWVCETLNSPAVKARCPTEHLFLESALECVHYSQWYWTQPCNPPSGGNNGGGGGGGDGTTASPPSSPVTPAPPAPGPGCEYDHGNGKPACIAEEMNRPWRNNWDPVHYWVCINVNSPAVEMRCPTEHLFLESALECVHWSQWYWTQPCNPPSGGNNGGGGGGGTVTPTATPTQTPITTSSPTQPPITTSPVTPGPTNPPGTCYYDHGNGQPLCIAEEMNRKWRNNWDNTRYWVCESLNTPAVAVICGTNTLFYEPALACVDVPLWQWTPPCNPPSTAQ